MVNPVLWISEFWIHMTEFGDPIMFKCRWFLTILFLGILNLLGANSVTFAQGDYSLSLSRNVLANPGEDDVCLYLILAKLDSVAGFDVFVKFNPELLTVTGAEATCRFQLFNSDPSPQGGVRIIARRHVPDSIYLSPLSPGMDTLGYISVKITSQDLLVDIGRPRVQSKTPFLAQFRAHLCPGGVEDKIGAAALPSAAEVFVDRLQVEGMGQAQIQVPETRGKILCRAHPELLPHPRVKRPGFSEGCPDFFGVTEGRPASGHPLLDFPAGPGEKA